MFSVWRATTFKNSALYTPLSKQTSHPWMGGKPPQGRGKAEGIGPGIRAIGISRHVSYVCAMLRRPLYFSVSTGERR